MSWLVFVSSLAITTGGSLVSTTPFPTTSSTTTSLGDQIKPINLNIDTVTSTSLRVTWQHSYNVPGISYTVNATTTDTNPDSTRQCQVGPGTQAVCSSLTPGCRYQITVTATSGSDSRSESTYQNIKPGTPGSLTNGPYLAPTVTLTWQPPLGKVDYYILTVSDTSPDVNCSSASCTVTGLKPGTKYSVTITAYSYGQSGGTRQGDFNTKIIPPGPPIGLMETHTTTTTISLKWNATETPGGTLTGYMVCYTSRVYLDETQSNNKCRHINNINDVVTHHVTGLTAGSFYDIRVYTTNGQFNSSESANISTQTREAVPGKVALLIVSVGHIMIVVSWQRPSSPNGNITDYTLTWVTQGESSGCSVYYTNKNSQTQSPGCPAPTGISSDDDRSYRYEITNLTAFTNYTITVVASTAQGEGASESRHVQTSVNLPSNVDNVTVIVLSSTAINVTWGLPESNPGPTNYTATARDATPLHLQNLTRSCTASGYSSMSCEINGLQEFWLYTVSVQARTIKGQSDNITAVNSTKTLPDVPGSAKSLIVRKFLTPSECDARKVQFTWRDPDPLDRNGLITSYTIQIYEDSSTQIVTTFTHKDGDAVVNLYNQSRQFESKSVLLDAEKSYTWKITSQTSDNENTTPTFPFTTGSCAPPTWTSEDPSSTGSTTRSVTVDMDKSFFSNNDQGQITSKYLVVSRKKENAVEAQVFWRNASQGDFLVPYKIILGENDLWKGSYEIGSAECDSQQQSCNGPLPAHFKFYLGAVVCTQVGCTESSWFGPFMTGTGQEPSGDSGFPVAAVVVPFVLILAVILVLTLLWYKGILNPRPCYKYTHPPTNVEIVLPDISRVSAHYRVFKILGDDARTWRRRVCRPVRVPKGITKYLAQVDLQKIGSYICEAKSTDHAHKGVNIDKNRWTDILPFDSTRVKLQVLDDDPTTDYINANYIHGNNKARMYIATQGPLPDTIRDFWRMIWEHSSTFIVMLVNCQQGSRTKCEQYWPSEIGGSRQYGDIMVTLDQKKILETHTVATLTISWQGKFLTVSHYHFLGFPDFTADVNPFTFIQFVKGVRNRMSQDISEPIVVHCSGGVGQTGTFIALDRLYQLLQDAEDADDLDTATVDIFGIVVSMRENRVNMVQTESQYIMIHECFQLMLDAKRLELGMPSDLHSLTGSLRRTNSGFATNAEKEYVNMAMIRKASTTSTNKAYDDMNMYRNVSKKKEESHYMNMKTLSQLSRARSEQSSQISSTSGINPSVI